MVIILSHKLKIRITLFTSMMLVLCWALTSCNSQQHSDWKWETISANGKPTARHEAGLVAYKDKIILIGGRRINPTDVFDTKTNTWTEMAPTPIEVHHFQPVVVGEAVYLIGAMTGQWPNEKPLDSVLIYYPEDDTYVYSHEIPKDRRRGGAGTVYYNNKIYLVGGITNGHMDGYKPWLDEYDPKTGEWHVLQDAPDARDHFGAAVVNNKLYAFAGRRTSKRTDEDMALTSSHGNIYDFQTNTWEAVTNNLAIPTQRAGNSVFVWQDEIIIGGGESTAHEVAHNEVEAYNSLTKQWHSWPKLNEGRHGSGFAVVDDYVYIASGSGNRGGGPELTTIERLKLSTQTEAVNSEAVDFTPVYKKWHTVELSFKGPETDEMADDNPFLNYNLTVDFKHEKTQHTVHGFYATDGNASETGAQKGAIWKVRFTPEVLGKWTYSAALQYGDSVAINNQVAQKKVPISKAEGTFIVTPSDKDGVDFRANGRLMASNGYYRFQESGNYWIKGGTNSPENLLAYQDFDGTYRMQASSKEGEASTTGEIHSYQPHLQDWKVGDPTWQHGKGKSLIGALNYLATKGMNSTYFLTLNILGDGKDVWPYVNPEDFTRFDVSKLEQWEIIFQHMQQKGIMLHMVLQETENETMLDSGDTGPFRQLYFKELVTRFGHHLALTWNLGEENGPASWSPIGQNDAQRKTMAKYLKENDPYKHPVLLHTHSHDPLRSGILDSILGYKHIDGLSLQQDKREFAPKVVAAWKEKSRKAGHEWLITMDEIGMWHTAALPDAKDPNHRTLKQHALWGTLLSGAAGVEWYFGAKYPHNDLTSEDWRQRNRLWELTNNATRFFRDHVPFSEMEPNHGLINSPNAYCLTQSGLKYVLYLPSQQNCTIDLSNVQGDYTIQWYDPTDGGNLQTGSIAKITGGKVQNIGKPSMNGRYKKDWVCLITRIKEQITNQ